MTEITNEQYWCEPNTMEIVCENKTLIKIVCAFYGIDPMLRCQGQDYTNAPSACYSKTSMQLVAESCDGRTSCSFSGEISFEIDSGFVNACPGYPNMLYVQWQCIQQLPENNNHLPTQQQQPLSLATEYDQKICQNKIELNSSAASTADECLSFSPYEPTFISNSSWTYFGYPVYQQLVCQGSRLIILCPLHSVIRIFAAYFGLQLSTKSSTCLSSLSASILDELPSKCYIPSTLTSIVEHCDSRQSCQLMGTLNEDFCPSFPKQLFVQYQCIQPSALTVLADKCPRNLNQTQPPPICQTISANNNAGVLSQQQLQSRTWCDGVTMSIVCPIGQTITVVCAFYGLHPSLASVCSALQALPNVPVCYFASSMRILSNLCNGQASCTISSPFLATFMSDPCVGAEKALFVQWLCA